MPANFRIPPEPDGKSRAPLTFFQNYFMYLINYM